MRSTDRNYKILKIRRKTEIPIFGISVSRPISVVPRDIGLRPNRPFRVSCSFGIGRPKFAVRDMPKIDEKQNEQEIGKLSS